MPILARTAHHSAVNRLLRRFPVVGVLGARQIGKTTLARQVASAREGTTTWFDLEDPRDLARLDDPILGLGSVRGLVVIDEIHRRPDLFPILRVLADRRPLRARFLVLGSASVDLLRQSSESLAGRIAFHPLGGLGPGEVGWDAMDRLWLRGGFPRAQLARSLAESNDWRRQFIATLLERDIPSFGVRVPAATLHRFWSMLAHWHAQVLNLSELGRAFAMSDTAVRHYLDVLTGTFVVRQLTPWHANISKRQVRSPKVYVADSGLLHTLLGIESMSELDRHPKIGASWEGFVIDTVVAALGVDWNCCHFWATHAGAELDLLVLDGKRRLGFEVKRTTAPSVTPSMRAALADLDLDRLDVIHAGPTTFPLAERIRAVSLSRLAIDLGAAG
jgi:predicted AAA+ superfamily ATPase